MDLGIEGKVAMVAGASRGLGQAVASALAAEGARVSIVSRDVQAIERSAQRMADETGADVLARAADVRSAHDIDAWTQATVDRFGGVDLLFTNAGGPPAGGFLAHNDAAWQSAFELLVLSTVRMIRAAVPSMRSRGGGSILVSTSMVVKAPKPILTLSGTMRAAVAALAKSLSVELSGDRIRVNHLIPGRIYTDRVQELDEKAAAKKGISVEEQRRQSQSTIPLARYGETDEFGRAAAFLLSPAASYVTGATLQVDGGKLEGVF